jgi:hypothetical protein
MSQIPPPFLPYATPQQSGLSSATRFESVQGRATVTFVIVAMATLCHAAGMWSMYAQANLLQRVQNKIPVTLAEAQQNDLRVKMLAGATLLLLLAGMILWLVWLHRAYRNLPALTGRPTKLTPGGAVGGNLIPFLNLVRIPQVMIELWNDSDPADEKSSVLVLTWWICWIASGIIAQVASALENNRDVTGKPSVPSLISMSWIYMDYHIVATFTGCLALWLLWGITDRQRRKARLIGLV